MGLESEQRTNVVSSHDQPRQHGCNWTYFVICLRNKDLYSFSECICLGMLENNAYFDGLRISLTAISCEVRSCAASNN